MLKLEIDTAVLHKAISVSPHIAFELKKLELSSKTSAYWWLSAKLQ